MQALGSEAFLSSLEGLMGYLRIRAVRHWSAITVLVAALFAASPARGDFMNVVTLTPGFGGTGAFTGFLNGVPLAGALTFGAATAFNPTAPPLIVGNSTIDGTSPQHSYLAIYTPSVALSDRIGFSAVGGDLGTVGHVKITFAIPIINPVIHVANLDRSIFDFSSTAGLGPLVLLNGNGAGDGDGLFVGGPAIFDGLPATADLVPHTSPPPTVGPRSGYGSVLIRGAYASLDFDVITPTAIENATFTLSSVPEPSSLVLAGLGIACLIVARRKTAV